jgi:hypothetical protein
VGSIGGSDPVNAPGVGKSGVGRAAVCVDGYVIHDVVVVVVVVDCRLIDSKVPSDWQENNLKICELGGKVDRGGRVVQYLHKSMAKLENKVTQLTPKALNRKISRQSRIIANDQVSMLGQSLIQLRRAQVAAADAIRVAEPRDLPSLVNALCKAIEQRRILLRIPGPPTGGSTKAATPAPINAQILDAEPIEPIEHVNIENPPLAAD